MAETSYSIGMTDAVRNSRKIIKAYKSSGIRLKERGSVKAERYQCIHVDNIDLQTELNKALPILMIGDKVVMVGGKKCKGK